MEDITADEVVTQTLLRPSIIAKEVIQVVPQQVITLTISIIRRWIIKEEATKEVKAINSHIETLSTQSTKIIVDSTTISIKVAWYFNKVKANLMACTLSKTWIIKIRSMLTMWWRNSMVQTIILCNRQQAQFYQIRMIISTTQDSMVDRTSVSSSLFIMETYKIKV